MRPHRPGLRVVWIERGTVRQYHPDSPTAPHVLAFAGVPYEAGWSAVEDLRPLVPKGTTMAQFALRCDFGRHPGLRMRNRRSIYESSIKALSAPAMVKAQG
jgi:hypothetical protein